MTSAQRLRVLAAKCDELATSGPSEEIRQKGANLAESYRRMADRDEWLESQVSPFALGQRPQNTAAR